MNDKELFKEVVKKFSSWGIYMINTIVYHNGEALFNTDGYNFHYNMVRFGEHLNLIKKRSSYLD